MLKPVFLLLEGAPVPFFIAEDGLTERNHTSYIVQFDGVGSQEQAERLLGAEVLLEQSLFEEEEWEDEEGDFFGEGFSEEEWIEQRGRIPIIHATDVACFYSSGYTCLIKQSSQ